MAHKLLVSQLRPFVRTFVIWKQVCPASSASFVVNELKQIRWHAVLAQQTIWYPFRKSGPRNTQTSPFARSANFRMSGSSLAKIFRLLVGFCGIMFESANDCTIAILAGEGSSLSGHSERNLSGPPAHDEVSEGLSKIRWPFSPHRISYALAIQALNHHKTWYQAKTGVKKVPMNGMPSLLYRLREFST